MDLNAASPGGAPEERFGPRTRSLIRRSRTLNRQAQYRARPSWARHRSAMRQFAGRHEGQVGAIIGNGPSLRETPLDLLADIPVFSLNRLYLMFDELGFRPTYHVAVNRYVVEQCTDELRQIGIPLFTTIQNLRHFGQRTEGIHAFPAIMGPRFDPNPLSGLWQGSTVTFVAMQLAFYMGFRKLVLVGVDHNFDTKGPANQVVESTGADSNHFHPDYFGKGFKWQLPNLELSEVGYALARSHFQYDNREIVDCTVGGKLNVFRKSSLSVELSN